MTVWIYVDTSKDVGDKDRLKVFADPDAAEVWFADNDPEGVAFKYSVESAWENAVTFVQGLPEPDRQPRSSRLIARPLHLADIEAILVRMKKDQGWLPFPLRRQ